MFTMPQSDPLGPSHYQVCKKTQNIRFMRTSKRIESLLATYFEHVTQILSKETRR